MELKWLEDFVSLANTRSFSKSAEQRNVTQPAFSRRIRALENWLGTALVDRSTYPTTLTEAGRSFRDTAEQALVLLHEARDDFRQEASRARATISLSVLHGITLRFLPPWLSEIQKQIGPISTRIDPGNFHDCVQALVEERYDFLLTYANQSVPVLLDPEKYPSIKLADDIFLPVSGTDNRKRPLFKFSTDRAKPTPWLSYASNSYVGRMQDFILSRQKPPLCLSPVCENPMSESLKAMALEGHGVAWLTKSSIDNELAERELAIIGTKAMQMSFDICLYRSIEKTRPQVIQFWSCVESLTQSTGANA